MVEIKVITRNDISMFEKDVEMFYNNHIENCDIECHYNYTGTTYTVLLIARGK